MALSSSGESVNAVRVARLAKRVVLAVMCLAVGVIWWYSSADPVVPANLEVGSGGGAHATRAPHAAGAGDRVAVLDDLDRVAVLDDLDRQAERGSIRVHVRSADGSPLTGVRVSLLPRRPDGVPWRDFSDGGRVDGEVVAESENGAVLFDGLRPDARYQLCVRSPGRYYFAAQPSPMVAMHTEDGQDRGSAERATDVVFDRSFDVGALTSKRVSGWVPVFMGVETTTELWRYEGGAIEGRMPGGPWDRVVIQLNRIDRGVHKTIGSAADPAFRFDGLAPFGRYDVQARAVRGADYYFASAWELHVTERASTNAALELCDPDSVATVELRIDEPFDVQADKVRVRLSAVRQHPRIVTGVVVGEGAAVRLHGMVGAFVDSLAMEGEDPEKFAYREPRLESVRENTLGLHNVIVVPARVRAGSGVTRESALELVPPEGCRYTCKQQVRLLDAAGYTVHSLLMDPSDLTVVIRLNWADVSRVVVKSFAGSPQINGKSRRSCQIVQGDGRLQVQDIGPPNGAGVTRGGGK